MLAAAHAQHALEFVREDFDEARSRFLPVVEKPFRARAPGQFEVPHDQCLHHLDVVRIEQGLQIHRVEVAALLGEISALIEDIRNAAAHPGREVPPARTEHQHQAVGHVLATVIADSLDHCGRA